MNTKSSKAAEALFRKQDKQATLSENDQRRNAELEKSARLRALRLAKEAADRDAAAQAADRDAAAQAAAAKAATKKPVAKGRKTVAAKYAVSA
jgi:hypothetical protein